MLQNEIHTIVSQKLHRHTTYEMNREVDRTDISIPGQLPIPLCFCQTWNDYDGVPERGTNLTQPVQRDPSHFQAQHHCDFHVRQDYSELMCRSNINPQESSRHRVDKVIYFSLRDSGNGGGKYRKP